MTIKQHGFLWWILLTANIIISLAYLTACLIPYVHSGNFWFISFLGLGFPILFFVLLSLLIVSLILRTRWWIVCLIVLLLGFQQIRASFAFNYPRKFIIARQPNTLRVMQWNVHYWRQIYPHTERPADDVTQKKMMQVIAFKNPDVLCVEEFFESRNTAQLISSVNSLDSIGFHYHYFYRNITYEHEYDKGIAIFSKYPITDSGSTKLRSGRIINPLLYADLQTGSQTVRIMACHLQSVKFDPSDYNSLSELKRAKEAGIKGSRTVAGKLKRGYHKRYEQAQIVREQVAGSPYPVILCGDFNDVPNSNTYFTIKKGMQDAFLKKGFFIGRTFRRISPTLRIDYILADKSFKVNQFSVIHVPYSDHFPVISDLSLWKNK